MTRNQLIRQCHETEKHLIRDGKITTKNNQSINLLKVFLHLNIKAEHTPVPKKAQIFCINKRYLTVYSPINEPYHITFNKLIKKHKTNKITWILDKI